MTGKNPQRRRIEDELGHGQYGPDAFDEVTVPPADERREAQRRDIHDPADVGVDMDELRDGGPTVTPGMVTTTGGKAGPASVHRRAGYPGAKGRKVAPTTTGDMNSGGRRSATRTSTSDASGGASQVGNFTDR